MVQLPNTIPLRPKFFLQLIFKTKGVLALIVCASLNVPWFFYSVPVIAGVNIAGLVVIDVVSQERPASSKAQNDEADFRECLKSLSLLTQEKSPDFQVVKALKEQRKYQKYTAKAIRYAPSVAAEISRERMINGYNNSTTSAASSSAGDTPYTDGENLTDWNINLDLPLYRRSVSVQDQIAGLEYDLAATNYDIAVKELEIKLRELLGNYILACYNLLSLENSILFSTEHVVQIQRGYDLRDQTKLALLRAQANLEVLKAKKETNEQRKDQAMRDLLDYTALNQGAPVLARLDAMLADEQQVADLIGSFSAVDLATDQLSLIFEDAPDGQLRADFEKNSQLAKRIRLEQELARVQAYKYTQGEFPEVAVRGELLRKEDTPFEDMKGEGTIGLVLKVPIFSGGTMYSNTMTEKLAQRTASIQGKADLRKRFNALANKRKTIQSLRKIYEQQKTHLQQQQEIVRLSLKSYQIKQTSMQELLNSKNDLIDAKSGFMQTSIDMNILLLQFAWEIGSPLSF